MCSCVSAQKGLCELHSHTPDIFFLPCRHVLLMVSTRRIQHLAAREAGYSSKAPLRDQILTVLSMPADRNCSPW